MSLEKLRQREVHRYYQPWLESPSTFDSSQPTPDSRYHGDGTRLNASRDTALIAFAQLGCLRLNAKRGIVTLIDSTRQYILAEATKTLSLISGDGARATEEEIWFGNASIPRGQGVSHDALHPDELTAFDKDGSAFTARALVVDNLADHPTYRFREYSDNGVSFYCGVPIVTKTGHAIGVYTITDDKPREGISASHLRFLTEMSQVVMHHLETSKNEVARFRGETLARGLGRYVQGHSSLHPGHARLATQPQQPSDRDSSSAQADPASTSGLSRTFKGMNITTADPQRLRPINVGRGTSTRSNSWNGKPSDGRGMPLRSRRDSDTYSPDGKKRPPSTSQGGVPASERLHVIASEPTKASKDAFVRAANILRQCAAADGVLFFDAASDRSGFNSQTQNPAAQADPHSRSQTSETSSSDEERNAGADTRSRHCQLLGYSIDVSESSSSNSESLARFELTQRTLSRLVKHYPSGKLFFFNTAGFSSSEEERSAGSSSQVEGSSQNSELSERTVTAGGTKKAVSRAVARELLRVVPEAKTVLWLPLWDFYNQRWAAGCFLWSRRRERLISAQDDLVYLKTFANSVMAEHSRAEAAKVDTAKTTFIANISHELRTPLHGILGSLDVLQSGSLTELQSSLAAAIEVSAKTLADTLDHVLDYAKINQLTKNVRKTGEKSPATSAKDGQHGEPRDMTSPQDEFDLAVVVEEVAEAVCASYAFYSRGSSHVNHASHKHATKDLKVVQVVLEIQDRDSWIVQTKPGAIRRVLTNLVGNSMKYTDKGSVKISLKQAQQTAQSQRSVSIQLTVTDTGSGMSQDFLDHDAFLPFRQESSFSAGAGLGLSIVQQIVRSYGGHISIQSQKGVGTEVTVRMSLSTAPPSLPLPGLYGGMSLKEIQERTKGMHLVLYRNGSRATSQDLDPLQLTVFESAIEQTSQEWLGMKTSWASFREDAKPEVCLYITAPTPVELAHHFEHITGARKASVIIVTANAVEQAKVTAQLAATIRELGITLDVISQPVGPQKLVMAVAKCLRLNSVAVSGNDGSGKTAGGAYSLTADESMSTGCADKNGISLPRGDAGPSPTASTESLQTVESKDDVDNRENTARPDAVSSSNTALTTSNVRILLVDDNAINIAILQQFMRRAKFPFDTATDGLQALEAYQKAYNDEAVSGFTHILMDISMPVMDGITSTHEIRRFEKQQQQQQQQNQKPSAVIIALSGVAAEETQNDILSAGADTFFAKPIKYKQLLEVIGLSPGMRVG